MSPCVKTGVISVWEFVKVAERQSKVSSGGKETTKTKPVASKSTCSLHSSLQLSYGAVWKKVKTRNTAVSNQNHVCLTIPHTPTPTPTPISHLCPSGPRLSRLPLPSSFTSRLFLFFEPGLFAQEIVYIGSIQEGRAARRLHHWLQALLQKNKKKESDEWKGSAIPKLLDQDRNRSQLFSSPRLTSLPFFTVSAFEKSLPRGHVQNTQVAKKEMSQQSIKGKEWMFVMRVERRDDRVDPQITEEPVRRGDCVEWGERGGDKKRSRARERVWPGEKNNRKPADSNGAPANPPEIKQPAATSPAGTAAPLHFSLIIVSLSDRLKD